MSTTLSGRLFRFARTISIQHRQERSLIHWRRSIIRALTEVCNPISRWTKSLPSFDTIRLAGFRSLTLMKTSSAASFREPGEPHRCGHGLFDGLAIWARSHRCGWSGRLSGGRLLGCNGTVALNRTSRDRDRPRVSQRRARPARVLPPASDPAACRHQMACRPMLPGRAASASWPAPAPWAPPGSG
jgi:hypothetical protein